MYFHIIHKCIHVCIVGTTNVVAGAEKLNAASNFYRLDDHSLHMQFVINDAASDNRAEMCFISDHYVRRRVRVSQGNEINKACKYIHTYTYIYVCTYIHMCIHSVCEPMSTFYMIYHMEGNFGGGKLWRIHYKIMFDLTNLSNSFGTKRWAKQHSMGACAYVCDDACCAKDVATV